MQGEQIWKYHADYEFKQSNWFQIAISKNAKGLEGNESNINSVSTDDVMFYVQECNLPQITFDAQEAHVGNRVYKSAGKPSYNESSLTFTDDLNDYVATYLEQWQREIFDPEDGRMGRKTRYSRNMVVYELTPEGDIINAWTFFGCWPSDISYGEGLNYESSDRRTISVTITYDYARITGGLSGRQISTKDSGRKTGVTNAPVVEV